MLSDIEISQKTPLEPIEKIAASVGIAPENLELYGTDRVLMLYTCANSTLSKERCMVFGVLVEMIQG